VAGGHPGGPRRSPPEALARPAWEGPVLSDREATLAEFEDYLRTVNYRDGRPYEEKTIEAYLIPFRNLHK